LCAVSIAADIVHVTGENRILAYYGLERLKSGKARDGFMRLIEESGNDIGSGQYHNGKQD